MSNTDDLGLIDETLNTAVIHEEYERTGNARNAITNKRETNKRQITSG